MAFISYAQNFEDIMLWRALKHVHKGFYIDVGANDPTVDSVTRAFYDRGWHGVNVEPMRQYFRRLQIERPSDINLDAAVGDSEGQLTFFDVADTGLSTMDAAIAAGHTAKGKAVVTRQVQMLRLVDICRQHVHGPIHFLKIDVEGFEAAVLRGMDFKVWRPWIMVIEATLPQTQTRNTDAWQKLVLDAGYGLAYFDGLNDFYVADEHAELLPAFSRPPNYFDEFTLRPGHYYSEPLDKLEHTIWKTSVDLEAANKLLAEANVWGMAVDQGAKEARAHAEEQSALATKLRAQLQQANQRAAQELAQEFARIEEAAQQLAQQRLRADLAEQLYHQAAASLAAVYTSSSWRITRPIRVLKRWARHPEQATDFLQVRVPGWIRRKLGRPSVHLLPMAPAAPLAEPDVQTTATPAETTRDHQVAMRDLYPASAKVAAAQLRQALDSPTFVR